MPFHHIIRGGTTYEETKNSTNKLLQGSKRYNIFRNPNKKTPFKNDFHIQKSF